ncbi:MAG: LysM peptidoglycan-binding domain-containing protein, partial [Planctomycetaceae bacterium]|nr:LysM peptidoglycan-binding domain-containing protein [Planctomycetaceae bacterium]
MSRKDKHNRSAYFGSRQKSTETEFDEMTGEYVDALAGPEKKNTAADSQKTALPDFDGENEDKRYFGNWLSIAGKTAMLAGSVVLLVGLYFGGKFIYKSLTAPAPEVAQEETPSAKDKPAEENKPQEEDLLVRLMQQPKEPEKKPEVKPAAPVPEKKPEPPKTDPFKETVKSEPSVEPIKTGNTVVGSPNGKNLWDAAEAKQPEKPVEKPKPDNTLAGKPKPEPEVQTLESIKPEPPKVELPRTESAKQPAVTVISDPWGTAAAAPAFKEAEKNTGGTADWLNDSARQNAADLKPLAPMKTVGNAADIQDTLAALKPMKTVGGNDGELAPVIPKMASGAMPEQTIIPNTNGASTFKTPAVPPVMKAEVADIKLNSIPPAVPLPGKLPEIIPSIPKSGEVQTFAAVKKDEPRPAIPADGKFAVPKDKADAPATAVPVTLPQHLELAKAEPLLGSQLQAGAAELRTSGDTDMKLNFGSVKGGAVRYSPKSEPGSIAGNTVAGSQTFAPLPMPMNPDNPNSNALLNLLPSGDSAAATPPNLPPLQAAPQAMIAPVNPGYRSVAAAETPNNIVVGSPDVAGSKAISFQQKLEQEIKKSPEATATYTVQEGDSYYTICERFFDTGLLFRALAEYNRQRFGTGYTPQPGTVIEVPTAEYLKTNYTEILNRIYRRRQASTGERTIMQSIPTGGQRYIAKEGDTVFGIATNVLR